MPTLVKVITKPAGQMWVLYTGNNRELFYTNEEISTVIDPYLQFEQSLPGYNAAQSNTSINGNVFKQCLSFDTMEHCLAAKAAVVNAEIDIVNSKNTLVRSRTDEIGVTYTVEFDIEP